MIDLVWCNREEEAFAKAIDEMAAAMVAGDLATVDAANRAAHAILDTTAGRVAAVTDLMVKRLEQIEKEARDG